MEKLLRIGYFELPKTSAGLTPNQQHWRDYFLTGEVKPEAPDYIKKASEIISYINLSEEERRVISALERLAANDQSEKETAIRMAKAEGKAEIAKAMLQEGLPPETVVKYTGLSLDYVKTLTSN